MSLRDVFANQAPGYCLPPALGANRQVLTVPSTPSVPLQLVWSTPGGGGQSPVRSGTITFQPSSGATGSWTLNYNLYTSGQIVTVVGQSASGTCVFTGTGGAAESVDAPFSDYEPMLGQISVGVTTCQVPACDEPVPPQISAALVITTAGKVIVIPSYNLVNPVSTITIELEPMAMVWSYMPLSN